MRILPFICILLLSCTEEISRKETISCTLPPSAYGPRHYSTHQTFPSPVVDGNPVEKNWKLVRWNKHYSDSTFQYKILWNYTNLFILVRTPLDKLKNKTLTHVDLSIFSSDSLLFCRENSLLSTNGGFGYRTKEEHPYIFTEIEVLDILKTDTTFLNRKDISINFSCKENQPEKIRLDFVP